MVSYIFSAVITLSWASLASASLTPPVLPLIVRNPYLSTWLPNARSFPWEKWPIFYTGQEIGFGVLASVPEEGVVYPLLGRPQDSLTTRGKGFKLSFPEYLGTSYDASTTNLTYLIPPPSSNFEAAKVTLIFSSPITPTSTLRQSLPAAYLSIHVKGSFDVSIYVDLNGQWVSGDKQSKIEWEYITTDGLTSKTSGLKTWMVKRQEELLFTEFNDRAEWGKLYFSGPNDVDHECGTSQLLRQQFSNTGSLKNRVDRNFRGIMEGEPVFAFSKSFSLSNNSIESHSSVLFTISHVQDPVVQYASQRGLTMMKPLWKSWFLSEIDMLHYHYDDYASSLILSQKYSDQLAVDAYKSGSTSYVDIVALSARQVMGATSFSGTPDSPLIFLKEISSNGNCQTVDVIFPSAPFFLYTNPRWLAYLLEPLLEHQLSGQYPNKYSMHDLGLHFPNETGHSDGNDEYMPVEECGNMLIMGLALANSLRYSSASASWSLDSSSFHSTSKTPFPLLTSISEGFHHIDDTWGDAAKGENISIAWLKKNYPLWKQWTGYLVDFSLEPHNQLSTDDFAGWLALQTNLALKGIVGIKAMAEIAEIIGETKDAKYYKDISQSYIEKWQKFGMSRDGRYAKLAYNWFGSWTTLYSLYADALLCFHPSITSNRAWFQSDSIQDFTFDPADPSNHQQPLHLHHKRFSKDFIPHSLYLNQSSHYALVMQKYGLPLDSRHLYTKSDWEFEAAAVSSPAVRKEILDRVARWVNETKTDRPLTDLYETEGEGGFPGLIFTARPVVGGHFAFLALERACGGDNSP